MAGTLKANLCSMLDAYIHADEGHPLLSTEANEASCQSPRRHSEILRVAFVIKFSH